MPNTALRLVTCGFATLASCQEFPEEPYKLSSSELARYGCLMDKESVRVFADWVMIGGEQFLNFDNARAALPDAFCGQCSSGGYLFILRDGDTAFYYDAESHEFAAMDLFVDGGTNCLLGGRYGWYEYWPTAIECEDAQVSGRCHEHVACIDGPCSDVEMERASNREQALHGASRSISP